MPGARHTHAAVASRPRQPVRRGASHRSRLALPSRRGLSLLELSLAVMVTAIMAAATLPLMSSAADTMEATNRLRDASRDASYAMERCLAIIRAAPTTSDPTQTLLAIQTLTPQSLVFSDGHGFALVGSTLMLRLPSGQDVPVCRNVQSFQVLPIAADGTASTLADPQRTWSFELHLIIAGFELRSAAMPRVRMVPP